MASNNRKSFMKIELDDEVDRILRAEMNRRDAGVASAPHTSSTGAHLDADALSLYVEQSLTPALRGAYTRHLIACSACREQAAMLAQLTEVADEANSATQAVATQSVATESNVEASDTARIETIVAGAVASRASILARLKQYFFVGHNLAYALPVIALVVLGAAIFLLTSRTESDSAALIADVRQPVAMNSNAAAGNMNSNASAMYGDTNQTSSNANGNFNSSPAPTGTNQRSEVAISPQAPAPTSPATTQNTRSPATPPETISVTPPPNQSPRTAPEIALRTETPSPSIAGTEADARRNDAKSKSVAGVINADEQKVAREAIAEAEENRAGRIIAAPEKRSADSAGAVASATQQAGAPTDELARRARSARPAVGASSGDKPPVARTIGGKRFVRRDATWVDESFVAGSALTDVRRNSAQYRALLTTEPALRSIVESLGGEIIIVAKNRAYRIR
jgi:NADH dehydrogenase/NADH:ubiquinone oxidoreductase subunit G